MQSCTDTVPFVLCHPEQQVMVFGEITTRAKVDYEAVVRKTCRDIGFISDDVGLDADKCKVRHRNLMLVVGGGGDTVCGVS